MSLEGGTWDSSNLRRILRTQQQNLRDRKVNKIMSKGFTSQPLAIAKIDEDQRMVFGIFNISKIGLDLVVDNHEESIETDVLEKAAYDFVLEARIAGENHVRVGVGDLVESVMLTYEKQNSIQAALNLAGVPHATIDMGAEFWWGGFHIHDDKVWDAVKKGELKAWSIGGSATQEEVIVQ